MARIFQIVTFSFIVALLTGCNPPEKDKSVLGQVKIGDLASPDSAQRPGAQPLKTINFNVYIFEIPAENVGALDDIRQVLYTKPLRFNDSGAFVANLFSVGFGEIQMWNKIAELLETAGAKKMPTVSLLLSDDQAEDIAVTRLYREQPLYYVSASGSMEGPTVGPGKLALRIKARKIPGARGVCYVEAHPVFSLPVRSSIPHLADRTRAGEQLFTCAGFGLKMSPGGLFLLGPEEYSKDGITLGSLFFSIPEGSLFFSKSEAGEPTGRRERKPAVRVFLVVCTSVNI
jgi:hypothetical protein